MDATHEVFNQPPPLENLNLFTSDTVLREAIEREGAEWATGELEAWGDEVGRAEFFRLGDLANRNPPTLSTHDRFGRRRDEVEYHPAWHDLMRRAVGAEVHSLAWNRPRPGAHVARAAKHYLLSQVEAGVGCPLTMTFAAVPALEASAPELAQAWIPRLRSTLYDARFLPAERKTGCLAGMAMTEKQGGSDVRANTTHAEPDGSDGNLWRLTGHKWFCSAPMCDIFLTLAYTEKGLSCFLVPRFLPDGEKNRFFIQRLKDKLGNRSNASSEIEYDRTAAWMVGREGRGIATIAQMVNHTRLDCMIGSTALMRQALTQALHHTTHREAFGRRLRDQPLMRNVLADLALECEAAAIMTMRAARAYDDARQDPDAAPLRRILTAIGKYWICKRAPGLVTEALECHGGGGYVEESILPRLYREAPLLSIWEGSGNVACLDVLRVLIREPEAGDALREELDQARGKDRRYDSFLIETIGAVEHNLEDQGQARWLTERLALTIQASLLLRHAPSAVAAAFCESRLAGGKGWEYGTLGSGRQQALVERASPVV